MRGEDPSPMQIHETHGPPPLPSPPSLGNSGHVLAAAHAAPILI